MWEIWYRMFLLLIRFLSVNRKKNVIPVTTFQLLHWLHPQLLKQHCAVPSFWQYLQALQLLSSIPIKLSEKPQGCKVSHIWPCESPDNLFYLTTQTCLNFPLILGPSGHNWLSCRPENRPTVIGLYFTDNSSTADNMLTAGSGLGRSPGEQVGRQEDSV